ncbi:MAG: fibrobacter succinogenes major paralogous domain-containing protein [Bacteroidales bacterium]|nr:fibrobacter succinogenes major paralogous domain-containing protein [Bacteroidales bacterium]
MRKLFIFLAAFIVSIAMLLTACKKDNPKPDDGGNNNNQETPSGGGGEVTPNQEYPETAEVLPQAVTDIDGNTYDAVQIGNQVWMAQNLRTTRYADGTAIPEGTSTSFDTPLRYTSRSDVATYGYLYNWSAVMHEESGSTGNPSGVQGICPVGWHVPSDAEWTELTDYMSTQPTYMISGNTEHLAKALAATWGWNSSSEADAPGNNLSTNNATGFSALPAGFYSNDCYNFGDGAYFWSASQHSVGEAYLRGLYSSNAIVDRYNEFKNIGYSVRCVHD